MSEYPWFTNISGSSLEQGDIFFGYPVFLPEIDAEVIQSVANGQVPDIPLAPINPNVIVLSQTCDLINAKVDSVILCPVWPISTVADIFGEGKDQRKRLESIRQGNMPAWHMLNSDSEQGLSERAIVEFKRIYTAPKAALEAFAGLQSSRLRLLPPYREHLAQAFARYFMRVGLPVDIPAFA